MPSPGTTIDTIRHELAKPGVGVARELPAGLAMTQDVTGLGNKTSMVHVRLTVTAPFTLFTGADNAAKGGGTKIYDFPPGLVVPMAAKTALVLSNDLPAGEQTAGELGLGSVVATGAVAVLSGTATFENFLTGGTLGNLTAGNTITANFVGTSREPIGDGVTPVDLYLNAATTFSDEASAHSMVVDSGTIDIWYMITDPS